MGNTNISLCTCLSKLRWKQARSTTEITPQLDTFDSLLVKDDDVSLVNTYFIGKLVPERYLVLLTEHMTNMLFQLMNCADISVNTVNTGSDYRTPVTPRRAHGTNPSADSNTNNLPSSLQLQSDHLPCLHCQMKMLSIEEFHQLHEAFRQVDSDRDHFLTRDDIRMASSSVFELTEYDIKEIMSIFDTDHDNRISLEEYICTVCFLTIVEHVEYTV
jgi:hypothetical protein